MTLHYGNRIRLLLLILAGVIPSRFAFRSSLAARGRARRHRQPHLHSQQESSQDSLLEKETNDAKFLRSCQVDDTIRNLREQLPQLLIKPLSDKDVEEVYSEDIALTGPRGEELAFGREELVSLSSTLVAATAAARQANAFASSFTLLNSTTTTSDIVKCEMAMDTTLQTLRVEWKVDLPIGQAVSKLVGLSDLVLNEDGKVCEHKVLKVKLGGQTLVTIGETLAALRRAVRTFGDSPLLTGLRDSPIAATLLTDIRNGLLQQQQQEETTTNSTLPPLYVVNDLNSAFESSTNNNMTLIDELPMSTVPLPGSRRWKSFAASRQAVVKFVEYGLPILSATNGIFSKAEFEQLFAPDAKLVGVDGTTVLATGGHRIANLYRTMASLRQGGDWSIAQVSTNYDTRSVVVEWKANNPIRMNGRDCFRLSAESLDEPVIETIEQQELKISGNRVNDPEWFRTFLTTIESTRDNVGVDMVVELLQQAGLNQPPPPKPKTTSRKGPPKLKQEAAASFYGILCALHRDLPTLTDATPQSPPAAEYIADNIELRGYLDEVLAKGSVSYGQVAKVLTASLRTALLTGRVTAESPPSPTIEFTAEGSIRVALMVNLKVKVAPGDSDLGAMPLKLELVSEYKVNAEGKIKEHKLVESRVNGQLTPGDVMSRWIKGTTTVESNKEPSFLDALAWARSFSGSSNSKRQ